MHNDRYKIAQDLADGWLIKYEDCKLQLTKAHVIIDRLESEKEGRGHKEVESLRQQLADSQKQVVMLRDAIDKAATQIKRCDYTPARSALLQALAATEQKP